MSTIATEVLIAVASAVVGVLATPAAAFLKSYTDRFRPHVKLALRILPFVDEDIMDGRITTHPVYDIAMGYAAEYAGAGVSTELLERAANEALKRLSLKVLDRKIIERNRLV